MLCPQWFFHIKVSVDYGDSSDVGANKRKCPDLRPCALWFNVEGSQYHSPLTITLCHTTERFILPVKQVILGGWMNPGHWKILFSEFDLWNYCLTDHWIAAVILFYDASDKKPCWIEWIGCVSVESKSITCVDVKHFFQFQSYYYLQCVVFKWLLDAST